MKRIKINKRSELYSKMVKKIKTCIDDMSMIAGQKAVPTKFKKSISN